MSSLSTVATCSHYRILHVRQYSFCHVQIQHSAAHLNEHLTGIGKSVQWKLCQERTVESRRVADWRPGMPPIRLGHAAATVEMRNDQSELSTFTAVPRTLIVASHCQLRKNTQERGCSKLTPLVSSNVSTSSASSLRQRCVIIALSCSAERRSRNSSNSRRSFSNETWVFDSWQSHWTQIDAGEGPSVRAYHSATVMLSSVSECECGKSLLIFGGLTRKVNGIDMKC